MTFTENIKSAIATLTARKLRSFLTMLGMIIGIASVIIVLSVGAGAQSLILNQIKSVGSDLIGILPGASDENGPPASAFGVTVTTLKYSDALALSDKSRVPHATAVAAYVRGQATMTWQNRTADSYFLGTTANYTEVENANVEFGRFFTSEEEASMSRIVVLGWEVAQNLFEDKDAVGEKIKIKREIFEVIGVMEKRGVSFFTNQDDQVFIPLLTGQKILLGIDHLNYIRAKVDFDENIDQTTQDILSTLREQHDITDPADDDFTVRSTKLAIDVVSQITNALKFFLTAIAALALIVGGVGIMNIMLVSVNERIREIGLRKAIGARTKHIMNQFLLETVVISLSGGIIGIIIGSLVSTVVAVGAKYLGYDWDLVISPSSIIMASGVSILIGLIFGLYPARRAAGLDPITALRYE